MSERIKVISIFREYEVEFVEDFAVPLKREMDAGGVLLIDANVMRLYEERIKNALGEKPYIAIEADEHSKTIDKSKELIETLVEKGVRRNQKLIAVGGGVVQDLVSFTASILYRGIEWVFFPTTLLAQGDSCIGSKTSINVGGKKNLVGTFYPPAHIYIDTGFLESLSPGDIQSGIGEMMHFYLYAASPYAQKVMEHYAVLMKKRVLFLEYIRESLSIKKAVAERDEFDRGERNKFNYGHTFGHALESVTDYAVQHGQAVTVGMDIANFLSYKLGLMSEETLQKLHALLKINFPSYAVQDIHLKRYVAALMSDKKNIGTTIGCILAEGPGKLVKKQIPADANLDAWLEEYFLKIYS